jgi:hypothetical protein
LFQWKRITSTDASPPTYHSSFIDERTVEELVDELRELRLRESAVIAQLKSRARINPSGTTTIARQRQTTREEPVTVNGLARGDRIRIKNKVRRPATWNNDFKWTKEKERTATITRVQADQIHFITDNGAETWRAPNNVKKI